MVQVIVVDTWGACLGMGQVLKVHNQYGEHATYLVVLPTGVTILESGF